MPKGVKAAKAYQASTPNQPPSPAKHCALTCDQVFELMSPPIRYGTYDELKDIEMPGYQREHFIPNSNFVRGPGRTGPVVPGMGNYSEGEAFTYFVYDDQSQGTEHKELTDRERKFAQELEDSDRNATVREWLDYMETQTSESLRQAAERSPDRAKARASTDQLAQMCAKCLRQAAEKRLVEMDVDLDAPMRNGQANGEVLDTDTKPRKRRRKEY